MIGKAFRYTGFYGRRTAPAITLVGKVFYGHVHESTDPLEIEKLEKAGCWEEVSQLCTYVDDEEKKCTRYKDPSEVYCIAHQHKLGLGTTDDGSPKNKSRIRLAVPDFSEHEDRDKE